ncbi:hypothetical protein HDU90_003154 [Geranomyces variabilis]|nr:hypothetical protein HDU90_003154 [Geranomyces variabilis]
MEALRDPGGVEGRGERRNEESGTHAENDKDDKQVAAQDDDLTLQQLREPVHNDDETVDGAAAGPSAALAAVLQARRALSLSVIPGAWIGRA